MVLGSCLKQLEALVAMPRPIFWVPPSLLAVRDVPVTIAGRNHEIVGGA